MRKIGISVIVAALSTLSVISTVQAATDHATLVKGPFKSGEQVTKVCLECHSKQAGDFMRTTHWTWKGTPNHIKGMENDTKEYGKANMTNAVCTSIEGGPDGVVHEQCGKCHAGYGWTRTNFDFSDKGKVDCLVCHAQKGNYSRAIGSTVDYKAMEKGIMNLDLAAQSVTAPTRKNCGYCHFYGGGGDAVKSPGLDSTLEKTTKKLDVHMGTKVSGGNDMSCQACHTTQEHKIAGASSMTAHYDARVRCEDCHSGSKAPHQKSKNGALISRHAASVACQTCHIPFYARSQATRMSWLWSEAGKDLKSEEQFDKETYEKKMGRFTWGMNEKPVYAWYNGKIERYMKGQVIKDPSKPVVVTKPAGNIRDATAKIYPYKLFSGDLPMDSKYKYLNITQQYKSFWVDFNWDKALQGGALGSGLPYSGSYQFVKTQSYFSINHEVAPREEALQCGECHLGEARMDWKALGYKGDPMQSGGRFSKNNLKKAVKR
ncbi:MAG TPA: tetrathionate reductase family octaheme c-type cytochrome [Desulfuromonadales bacterium]|nr:tetrathionate reductase family octaheme c-type cytochrome [Desulfuromonadales bacterium]